MASPCNGCGAPVDWVRVAKTGKRMPLDPEPRADGNIGRIDGGDTVEYVLPGGGLFDDRPLYVSHFATCPKADQFRRPKK